MCKCSGKRGCNTTSTTKGEKGDSGESYLVYTAIINQSGVLAPTVSVLKNTLGGTLVWTYDGVGTYLGTLAGVFTSASKVFFIQPSIMIVNSGVAGLFFNNSNSVVLNTFSDVALTTPADSLLTDTSIEIRVYQ